MTCKFTKVSRIALEPSIAATNPSLLIMGLHITYLANIAKKQQIKHQIPQGKSINRWRWHLIEGDEWNARIIETNVQKKLEVGAKMVVPVSLGEPLVSLEENGGRWGEIWLHPSPFLFFSSDPARPGELNFFFFAKFLLSLLLYIFPS